MKGVPVPNDRRVDVDGFQCGQQLTLFVVKRGQESLTSQRAAIVLVLSRPTRAARVTRGALYHHFEDKKALFDAVVVLMQAEAAVKIEQEARKQPAIWDRLIVGIGAYLDVCLDPAYARIVIQEGPAVLGADRYREIEEAYPQALLKETFKALKRRGELHCEDIDLLTRMADAMICKMAIMLPDAKDPKQLRKRGQSLIGNLLESLRKR